jgi:LacI family transcriptional regulator
VSDEPSQTRGRHGRSPTLADVGELAGVSAATASRVLNGTGRHVAEALRKRVLAAAEQLDYIPNAHAQALVRRDSRVVGVIAFDVNNPFFTEIIGGILGVAAQTDRLVTIGNVFRDPQTELRYLSLLHSQRVGSLVLTGSGWRNPEHVRLLQARLDGFRAAGGRVVLIGHHDLTGDVLLPDNEGGGGAAARALLELGHTRIGVISGHEEMTVTVDRLRGFLEPCAAAGHPVPPQRIVPGSFTTDGGASAMISLLERAPDITAVFCLSDSMAVGALRVLRHRGIDVPRRISVIGFDDIALAEHLTPALSTVRVPLVQLGEAAMRLVLEPEPAASRTQHFATELRLRGTTGPAPA